ncbi:MAG: response regulator [Phycisphaerales bacterium]|nr:response regulator [Phycisphaerales bacterium]
MGSLARIIPIYLLIFSIGAFSLYAIQQSINASSPSGPKSPLWGDNAQCAHDHDHSSSTGYAALDFFTADGNYLPRTHCMTTQTGETDWFFVWILVALNAIIIMGYARIFVFWRRAYLQEEQQDRNKKLMDLAWIFLFCAICGYVSSIVLFFWPAYRLLALALVPLGFFTWKFASNLEEFKISLGAKRLARELNESLTREKSELEAKVEEVTEGLRVAKERAEAADKIKGEFLAQISHEIRTPLTAIIGYSDIALARTEDESEEHSEIQTIKKNSTHLLNLINDVLDFTQIESGSVQYEQLPCSIREIANEVIEMMTIKAMRTDTGVFLNIHPDIPHQVIIDPTRVKQIITNLVGNAVKFTNRGEVFVEISPAHEDQEPPRRGQPYPLSVIVRDTGIGIASDRLEAIFDSFTQESVCTRREYGGTGLGLAISKRIAQDLGGDLVADSHVGIGSVFTFTINAEVSIVEESITKKTKPKSSHYDPRFINAKILLVEDGPDNRNLVAQHFKRLGIPLEFAHDGVYAIEMVHDAINQAAPYDLILMDISMPRMDGVECTQSLRSKGVKTPIVMLTAHVFKEERDRCIAAGANEYHCKPIDFPALFDTCNDLLSSSDTQAA